MPAPAPNPAPIDLPEPPLDLALTPDFTVCVKLLPNPWLSEEADPAPIELAEPNALPAPKPVEVWGAVVAVTLTLPPTVWVSPTVTDCPPGTVTVPSNPTVPENTILLPCEAAGTIIVPPPLLVLTLGFKAATTGVLTTGEPAAKITIGKTFGPLRGRLHRFDPSEKIGPLIVFCRLTHACKFTRDWSLALTVASCAAL